MWPWQREKPVKMMKSLTASRVDKPLAQPYLCQTGSMAMARIWLRFWPLNLGLPNSHSFGGCSRIGAGAAMRHDELIGTPVDHFTAATPNRKDRNLA
jgi:hypothetical protein